MLITGLPYDPTYYGKSTFLVFPQEIKFAAEAGTVEVDYDAWFGPAYVTINKAAETGSITVDYDAWFGPAYVTINKAAETGTIEHPAAIIYNDLAIVETAEMKAEIYDERTTGSISVGRMMRQVTWLEAPNIVVVPEHDLIFTALNIIPPAPYADTEEGQAVDHTIQFTDVAGSQAIPLALSEFVPRG